MLNNYQSFKLADNLRLEINLKVKTHFQDKEKNVWKESTHIYQAQLQ